MKPSELKVEVHTGKRLFYVSHDSLYHTLNTLEDALPPEFSLFLWTPFTLTCERYVKNGRAIPAEADKFTKQHAGATDMVDVLSMVLNTVKARFENRVLEEEFPKNYAIVFVNPLDQLNNAEVKSKLQEIISYPIYANEGLQLIMYSYNPITEEFLTKFGHEIEIDPLTDDEIEDLIQQWIKGMKVSRVSKLFINNKDVREAFTESVRGMTPESVMSVLDWGLRTNPETKDPKVIRDYADDIHARVIRQSELLTFLPPTSQIDPKYLGGFSAFTDYMKECGVGFSPEAKALKIEPPKGVLLVGLPGTGKSMAVKTLSYVMGMRTIILNFGAVFGSYVGESESRMRRALRQIEGFGRCILFIDELDKALAGASGAVGDSGTTQRVLGTFLTWLQEKKSETFVVGTMNELSHLPPEFLRAGRFDRIFYTALPVPRERKDIIIKQFDMHGLKDFELTERQWEQLLEATEMFSGAELATMVIESQRQAFHDRKTNRPTFDELLQKAEERMPQSKSNPALLAKAEQWKRIATPVSKFN